MNAVQENLSYFSTNQTRAYFLHRDQHVHEVSQIQHQSHLLLLHRALAIFSLLKKNIGGIRKCQNMQIEKLQIN